MFVTLYCSESRSLLNRHKFGEKLNDSYIIPALWLSVWSAAGPIGMMAGSLVGGYLQDHCGRRASLCVGSMLSAVAVTLCYVSDLPDAMDSRRGMFLGGKLVQGCATGMMLCVVQTYMSEVLPTTLRGPIIAFFPVFTLLGQLIGAVVVHICSTSKSADSYRIAFASQWPLVCVLLVVAILLPESPSWLMRRNRSVKALRSQQRLGIAELDPRPIGGRMGVLNDPREQIEGSNAASYMDCFKGNHQRRTFIIAFASSLPQLFGLTLLSNASYFLQMVGMDANDSTVFLILGIGLGFISNIVSVWALSAGGRRILSLMTLGIATILWLAMGVAGCFSGAVVTWYVSVAREREKMKTQRKFILTVYQVYSSLNDGNCRGLRCWRLASVSCCRGGDFIITSARQSSRHWLVYLRPDYSYLLDYSSVHLQCGRGQLKGKNRLRSRRVRSLGLHRYICCTTRNERANSTSDRSYVRLKTSHQEI